MNRPGLLATNHARLAGDAQALFDRDRRAIFTSTDRLFAGLLLVEWLASIAVALIISPRAWVGTSVRTHVHVWAALLLGGAIVSLPIALALARPGRVMTRHVIAIAQMLIGSLLIHLSGGRIETHFHIFGSLAFLAFYRDWRVLISASVVVTADHLLRDVFWPRSIFGVFATSPWRWVEHAGWVLFEDVFLIWSCCRGVGEMHTIADHCAELSGSQALLRAVIEGIPDPLFVKDRRGQFVLINSAAARFVGRLEEEILGRRDADLFEPDAARRMGETDVRVLSSYQTETSEWSRSESNATRTYLSTISIYRDHQGEVLGLVHLVLDLTDRKRIEQRLEYQALHDSLTDLPNRVQIQTLLERGLMPDPSGHIAPAALLLIDLDRFKEINDTFGHHYGDAVLQQFSHRLRAILRRSDMVARLGGDEFGILLPGGDEMAAVQVAENVLDCLKQPIVVEGNMLDVGASIGIALRPEHGLEGSTLMQCADVAMYTAKRGRLGHAVYTNNQSGYTPRRLTLARELREGIENNHLRMHYQPKIDLRTMRVAGAEALVRWLHPREGLMPPGEFIPLAEHTGLIKPLGLWTLDAALMQCHAWHQGGLNLNVAVNLAAENLQDRNLVEMVVNRLEGSDSLASWLTLEITEGAMIADPLHAREVLSRLHDLGVRISIDDFGTGYSSLAYLKMLPVDEIKIDQSFVQGMATSKDDACIVRSIIDLGHNLGLRVVAEGIENGSTLELLTLRECDFAQGHYISRPRPASGFVDWLREPSKQRVFA